EHDLAKVGVASSSLVSRSIHRSTALHRGYGFSKKDASASFFWPAKNTHLRINPPFHPYRMGAICTGGL
ncbi:hypothetical protein ACW9H6_07810, partial [Pseudomonas sp. SDO528_S397]